MANRTDKISQEIKKEISKIVLRELKDPRVPSFISFTHVKVTKDLKYCQIYFSTLEDVAKKEETKKGLESASGFIKRELGRRLKLRAMPQLSFIIDNSIEEGVRMSKLIDDTINKEKK